MNKLTKITEVKLPLRCISFIYDHFRKSGAKGLECVGIFAGKYNSDSEFEITQAIIPAHKAFKLEGGLLYSVGEEELHRINVFLYENSLSLIAQIHSHPRKAYHSKTDDAYPIIATIGALSIVVPDFAFGEFKLDDWAIYRLSKVEGWAKVSSKEVNELIKIV